MNTAGLLQGYKVTSQSVIHVILEKRCLALLDTFNISVSSTIYDMARIAKAPSVKHDKSDVKYGVNNIKY